VTGASAAQDTAAGVLESARAPAEVALDCLDEVWAESANEWLLLSEACASCRPQRLGAGRGGRPAQDPRLKGGAERGGGQVCVWVDPLDGTKEFTQERFEFVSVLVGVTLRGRPVAGVIAEPYYRYYFPGPDGAAPATSPAGDPSRVLWGCALPGVGAHVLGEPGWRAGRGGAGRGVVITSRSRTAGRTLEALERLQARGVATAALQAGGAGHKMARVIDGAADVWLMPIAGTSKWDTCAGEAVLAAAGGAVADAAGGALRYDPDGSMLNSEGVIAACSQRLLDAALDACRHHPAP
jgi:3'-phosphoadenosine 5'-phosphosulfate (PAPS) 3'-phosphatase